MLLRKAEFRLQAEKAEFNYHNRIEKGFNIYLGCQYRWENSAEPIYIDREYFLNESDCQVYVAKLKLDVGFSACIECIFIPYDEFNEFIDFKEHFEMSSLDNYKQLNVEKETIYMGNEFQGDNLEGAILYEWDWEKYIGYSRNIHSLRLGDSNDTEASISTGNEERTFHNNVSVLLTASEVAGLDDNELIDLLYEELNKEHYKFNYFNKVKKKELIGMICSLPIDEEND